MTKLHSAILSLILLSAAPALAEDTPRRDGPQFGVGVETSLLNISLGNNAVFNPGGAVLLSYDARAWRIEGLFGVLSFNDNTVVRGGGRVLFAVHQTSRSDFSLGLGGYVLHAGENFTLGEVDALAQLRAFIVENVALTGSLGVAIAFGEGDPLVNVGGNLLGSLGMAYYF